MPVAGEQRERRVVVGRRRRGQEGRGARHPLGRRQVFGHQQQEVAVPRRERAPPAERQERQELARVRPHAPVAARERPRQPVHVFARVRYVQEMQRHVARVLGVVREQPREQPAPGPGAPRLGLLPALERGEQGERAQVLDQRPRELGGDRARVDAHVALARQPLEPEHRLVVEGRERLERQEPGEKVGRALGAEARDRARHVQPHPRRRRRVVHRALERRERRRAELRERVAHRVPAVARREPRQELADEARVAEPPHRPRRPRHRAPVFVAQEPREHPRPAHVAREPDRVEQRQPRRQPRLALEPEQLADRRQRLGRPPLARRGEQKRRVRPHRRAPVRQRRPQRLGVARGVERVRRRDPHRLGAAREQPPRQRLPVAPARPGEDRERPTQHRVFVVVEHQRGDEPLAPPLFEHVHRRERARRVGARQRLNQHLGRAAIELGRPRREPAPPPLERPPEHAQVGPP